MIKTFVCFQYIVVQMWIKFCYQKVIFLSALSGEDLPSQFICLYQAHLLSVPLPQTSGPWSHVYMQYSYIDQGISEPFMSCKDKVYVNIIRSNIIQFKK